MSLFEKSYTVYIMASGKHGTLYIGMTSNLPQRVHQHKNKTFKGFTAQYDVDRLVWYESFEHVDYAIAREKKLKTWRRDWKVALVEEKNPGWVDLSGGLAHAMR